VSQAYFDGMRGPRLPHSYWAFVLLSFGAPPLIMVITGQKIQPRAAALVFVALILWALGRGSMFAWGLSLLWNAVLLLAFAAVGATGVSLSGVLLLLTTAVSLWALLSPSMRELVGLRRQPPRVPGPSVG
jgi:hypothetical protein